MRPQALTDREVYLIRSATGTRDKPSSHRNYFLVDEETADGRIWVGLVERGLAARGRTNSIGRFFHVTNQGAALLGIRILREDQVRASTPSPS